ncbi:hypothetical protein L6164_028156 [Bauhinia variegata]|uniref:Uncharacterized protein n=1 Tax=Bauhinia variegata TaxID=167791 RepID=A0ACB9LWS2_BAUVA|nr:hypothetical protein L6164_028156 [Bauhinia variegata]
MEEEMMQVFVAYEIDLDYEFDAARFFDFSRQETPAEARQAELWFETAGSYPPSPFVSKLVVRDDILLDDSNSRVSAEIEFSEKVMDDNGSKEADGKISSGLLGGILKSFSKQPSRVTAGLALCSKTFGDGLNYKAKAAMPRSSTLMNPTVSQLAKQNRPPQYVGFRFAKLLAQDTESERSLLVAYGVENQASKRQKLEGGVLRKVAVADIKQQTNFVHKAPKKDVRFEQNSAHAKLKLTIPREPDLETAHRAQRMRNTAEAEHVTVALHRYKARPLNKKILDAPSLPLPQRSTPRLPEFQEFHLKTLERAMQQSSASSSSSLHCNASDKDLGKHSSILAPENKIRDSRRPGTMTAPKHDKLNFTRNFKARPLNKKIFSSKGEIGVLWNSEQETTVPMEFKLHTEKRIQHSPPIELFSKLCLASELQPNDVSQLKPPRHTGMFRKDSKENILSSFHPERKEKPSMFGGKQTQCGSNDCIGEAGRLLSARRSLGIR